MPPWSQTTCTHKVWLVFPDPPPPLSQKHLAPFFASPFFCLKFERMLQKIKKNWKYNFWNFCLNDRQESTKWSFETTNSHKVLISPAIPTLNSYIISQPLIYRVLESLVGHCVIYVRYFLPFQATPPLLHLWLRRWFRGRKGRNLLMCIFRQLS